MDSALNLEAGATPAQGGRRADGRLVAVIGASGAGKTLLLEAMAGIRGPASRRPSPPGTAPIGYLPQDDIVHLELPLDSMLGYAARLRLPAATSADARQARVREVLRELGLDDRAKVRVGSLSGGERKRASIGVELLSEPSTFFLDEPTSGLDPVTAAELIRRLRALADTGVTVTLTTHHAADVEPCDQVVVLGPGGRVAFSGPPAEALEHFAVDTIEEIYLALARDSNRPTMDGEPAPAPALPSAASSASSAASASPSVDGRRIGPVRETLVLARRTADILRRNRLTLGILLGSPLAVLAMFLMLFRSGAFDPQTPSPGTSVMILFWIAFGGFFFGLTYGLLQICTEQAIVRRERLAGVRLVPYLLSKVAVLLPLLAVVDLVLLGLLRLLDRLPALAAPDFAALYLTLLLATAAALGLGLLCSAAVSDVSQATLALPMLCFPQVLFVGAILPMPQMAAVGRWLSYAMSNRWSFEALGHSAGLPDLLRHGRSPLGPPLLASYGDSFARPVWENWCLLAGFTVLFLIASWAVLSRRSLVDRRG